MKKPLKVILYVLSSLLVLGVLVATNHPSTPVGSDLSAARQENVRAQAAAKPNAKRDLVLQKASWLKSGSGSIGVHSFSVFNASANYNYPTITVRFSYYSDVGDEVSHIDKVIDKAVRAGQTIHIDKLEIGPLNDHADGADMEIL